MEIIYDSDDEPPVNVSPPKPDVPKPKPADDDHDEPNEQSSPPSPINAEISPPKLPTLPTPRKVQPSKTSPASPPKAEVTPSKRPAGRPVRPRKHVAVNGDKVTETPTAVQNPPSAESELEKGFRSLELSDG